MGWFTVRAAVKRNEIWRHNRRLRACGEAWKWRQRRCLGSETSAARHCRVEESSAAEKFNRSRMRASGRRLRPFSDLGPDRVCCLCSLVTSRRFRHRKPRSATGTKARKGL
jgi:hypothetical protein